jgi:hypothetical protein
MLVQRTKKRKWKNGNETKRLVSPDHIVDVSPVGDTGHVCITAEPIKDKVTQVILSDNDLWRVMRAWIGRMPIVQRDLDKTLEWLQDLGSGDHHTQNHLKCIGRRLIACHAALALVVRGTASSIGYLSDVVQAGDDALDNLTMFRDQISDMLQGEPIRQPTRRPAKKAPEARTAKKKHPVFVPPQSPKPPEYKIFNRVAGHIKTVLSRAIKPKPTDGVILSMGASKLQEVKGIGDVTAWRVHDAVKQEYPDALLDWQNR